MPATNLLSGQARAMTYDETKPTISGIPVALTLPTIDTKVAVKRGVYNASSRSWTISSDTAYYAAVSEPANNQGGTTLIYGHNRETVFAKLADLKTGDAADVTTDNKRVFHYVLSGSATVTPDDTRIAINPEGLPRLVLQTCTGIFWEKRQLYIFELERVD